MSLSGGAQFGVAHQSMHQMTDYMMSHPPCVPLFSLGFFLLYFENPLWLLPVFLCSPPSVSTCPTLTCCTCVSLSFSCLCVPLTCGQFVSSTFPSLTLLCTACFCKFLFLHLLCLSFLETSVCVVSQSLTCQRFVFFGNEWRH